MVLRRLAARRLAGLIAVAMVLASACSSSSTSPSSPAAAGNTPAAAAAANPAGGEATAVKPTGQKIELVNVSYDPTRELYEEYSQAFAASYLKKTGIQVEIKGSHGGSGSQARAVIDGLEADVVTLALAWDIESISRKGLIKPGWQSRLEHNSSPYTSTIVFLVRKGNPKGIKNWGDLVKPGTQVITPNPRSSGGARWSFLAAWGSITLNGGGEDKAKDFVGKLYANVPVLDTGARGSTTTFAEKGIGDVLIAWENEAILAQKEQPGQFEIVYPEQTILAEPPVAMVDANVDKRKTRAAAEDFLSYLYSDEGQNIAGRHGYRPRNAGILARYEAQLPPVKKLFTIKAVAGDWEQAQNKFFNDGGVFDQVYQPR